MSALTIIKAVYAGSTAGADVTQKCQAIVDTGNDDIAVNNTAFGDSDPNHVKSFTIEYKDSFGVIQFRGCQEGSTLDLV